MRKGRGGFVNHYQILNEKTQNRDLFIMKFMTREFIVAFDKYLMFGCFVCLHSLCLLYEQNERELLLFFFLR